MFLPKTICKAFLFHCGKSMFPFLSGVSFWFLIPLSSFYKESREYRDAQFLIYACVLFYDLPCSLDSGAESWSSQVSAS